MERIPRSGEIYQHFKGNLYRIVTLARHTETGEQLVVYQALYGDFQVYARPLSMFVSEVDHEKYPDAAAKYRFTLIPGVGEPLQGSTPVVGSKGMPQSSADGSTATGTEPVPAADAKANPAQNVANSMASAAVSSDAPQESAPDSASGQEEFQLDPRLLAFLEADSYEEKLEVFASLEGKLDEDILNTIAVSLDLELSGDSLEEQYATLKNCLLTLEKYECNRLR